uniref:Protein kinase domain containing protein n=1 Tax=Oryza sativa subsp. japonica TaxID=39947 RepID=Q33BB6_ORYSJ|nr:Protein kinase domain containing protein [Oryza sativa Japonica Group]
MEHKLGCWQDLNKKGIGSKKCRRDLYGAKLRDWRKITHGWEELNLKENYKDKLWWNLSKDGKFTVKSFYNALKMKQELFGFWIKNADKFTKNLIVVGIAAVIWSIWKCRNKACLEKKLQNDPTNLIHMACNWVDAWAVNRKRSALEQDDATIGGDKKRLRLGSIYDYRKLAVLGEGRDGVVFKAEHLRTGDMVAIKWVRAAADHRAFIREVGCLAACRSHRNIVEVRDVVEDANTRDMFIVMDFVGGRTLHLDLWMTHPDPEEKARLVMRDLVAAAGALRAAGVMHRNIKPDNVLVTYGGGLKLCDFVRSSQRPRTLFFCSKEDFAGRSHNNAANENQFSLMAVLACNKRKSFSLARTWLSSTKRTLAVSSATSENPFSVNKLKSFFIVYHSTKCDYHIYIYVIVLN